MADRQLLLVKKEVTYGTAVVLAAADTIWAEGVRYTPKGTKVESDPAKPGVGGTPSQVYGEHAEITFEVPLSASGTAGTAPKWGPLIKACGLGETVVPTTSVTYRLLDDPSASDSLTIGWREANRSHQLIGARGKVGLKFAKGGRPMLVFTFRGLHQTVAAGASLVAADANFTGWVDARPVAQGRTTFSLSGQALPLRDLTLDANDNIKFVDLPHQENVRLLGPRSISGRVKCSMPPVATYNPETPWLSRANVAFSLVHNTTAGSIITVTGQGQMGEPSYARDDGDDTFEQAYDLIGSTLAASDDLIIALT